MQVIQSHRVGLDTESYQDLHSLLLHRTVLIFWIGIVSFLLYGLLDYVVHPDLFSRFLFYRLGFCALLLVFLGLLHFPVTQRHVRLIATVALSCASLTISLMSRDLGGFSSSYYLGIVLIVAFVFSFLPFDRLEVALVGLVMYLVYLAVLSPPVNGDQQARTFLLNNSFFYFSILAAATIKRHNDALMSEAICIGRSKVRQLRAELETFTGDLQEMVRHRMQQTKELELCYQELYENIQDMLVLVDRQGRILQANSHFRSLFADKGDLPSRSDFFRFVDMEDSGEQEKIFRAGVAGLVPIKTLELVMRTAAGQPLSVEINGSVIDLADGSRALQLVLRDISEYRKMEKKMLESNRLLDRSRRVAILGLAKLAEYRDQDTGDHLERIRAYTSILTRELASKPEMSDIINDSFVEDIVMSSVLHDIGKVGIPDEILLKPGRLSREEFEIMKRHTLYGRDALQEAERDAGHVSFLRMGQEIALYHHERWDGGGYPEGRSGTDIPLSARIVALADVYDALTSRRSYKKAFSHERARTIIAEERGRHFDPAVVDAFLAREDGFRNIRMQILLG